MYNVHIRWELNMNDYKFHQNWQIAFESGKFMNNSFRWLAEFSFSFTFPDQWRVAGEIEAVARLPMIAEIFSAEIFDIFYDYYYFYFSHDFFCVVLCCEKSLTQMVMHVNVFCCEPNSQTANNENKRDSSVIHIKMITVFFGKCRKSYDYIHEICDFESSLEDVM